MKKAITILMAIILASTGILTAYAGKPDPLPAFLKGNRISVHPDSLEVSSSEPSFVIHGFIAGDIPWKELTKAEKKSWLKDATFELEIDGEPVEMKRWIHIYQVFTSADGTVYEDIMLVLFYVKFDAGQFEPGTYEFKGFWNMPDGAVPTNTCEVTFT
jgi:hypothetical protein